MTYSEAVEIMRYVQKKTNRAVRLSQAIVLANFSFPLDQKLAVIDQVCYEAWRDKREIYSLYYFREQFRVAESYFHKGSPPVSGDNMMRVSEILEIRSGSI